MGFALQFDNGSACLRSWCGNQHAAGAQVRGRSQPTTQAADLPAKRAAAQVVASKPACYFASGLP